MRIAFLGNFHVPYCSEVHHVKSLEALGHSVVRIQEPQQNANHVFKIAEKCELFIWVHTHGWNTPGMKMLLQRLKIKGIPTLTYHLDLWKGLNREKDMQKDDYWHIAHFFTVDKLMADHLNKNTQTKGHYVQAGVFDRECTYSPQALENEVIFVGSKGYHEEWKYRPQLIDWLKAAYGDKFKHFGGDGLGVKRGQELNDLYAKTKVVVGDSLCINFDYPHYWSDRVYETLGRGGFLIHPYIKGMEEHFEDGKHLVFYKFGDFEDLKAKIDYYLTHDDEREAIRIAGHEHVKKYHTYMHRWDQILSELQPKEETKVSTIQCLYCRKSIDICKNNACLKETTTSGATLDANPLKVYWHNGKGNWNHGGLMHLFEENGFEEISSLSGIKSCVVVCRSPFETVAQEAPQLIKQMHGLEDYVFIYTEENNKFPFKQLPGSPKIYAFYYCNMPDGVNYTPAAIGGPRYETARLLAVIERKEEYFCAFVGQVQNMMRRSCIHNLQEWGKQNGDNKIFISTSNGFGQGLKYADYLRTLKSTKIMLCPHGNTTPDTIRMYEALEAGCLPVVEDSAFWSAFDVPFPVIDDWSELGPLLDIYQGDPALLDSDIKRAAKWWSAYKGQVMDSIKVDLGVLNPAV